MNDLPDNEMNDLIKRAVRGELTEAEKRQFDQRLAVDSAFRDEFELERSLDHALEGLPNIPVATNFTHLVMESVRSQSQRPVRPPKRLWRFPVASVRLAAGLAVIATVGVFSVNEYRKSQQQEMVRSVASFTGVASAIGSEESPNLVFQDFDAIKRYSVPADSELDLELLVALQK